MSTFKPFTDKIAAAERLTADEARQAFDIVMSGGATPAQIGAFLMGLRVRGETVDEITGAARVMRAKASAVSAPPGAVDTCGTGGDAKGTQNISTCAAFIVAGAGVPVAKHGNKSISSKSGSADVLTALGVRLDISPEQISRCIEVAGVGFMFAPAHHSAMRHVGPVRQELATRTIFNLLGPLSNPAGTTRQLIGVFSSDWLVPLAEVLKNLGSERVWVVHGSDGLDELTTTGASHVAALADGTVRTFQVEPGDLGLMPATLEDLRGGDGRENAEAIRAVLGGEKDSKIRAFREIAALNAAAALIVAGKAKDLSEGLELAFASIDGGAAVKSLELLIEHSNA